MGRVVLVESSAHLPELYPFQSWEVLRRAAPVLVRDPADHPSAPSLELADIALAVLDPGRVDLAGVDLLGIGDIDELRRARALVDLATEGEVVYLLGPDDPESFMRVVGQESARAGHDVEFVFHPQPHGAEMIRLAEVERALRDPETGCPWDLEQDHASLARYLLEEAYELFEAIDDGDDAALREELGDVLLQVVFHAQIAADRGAFTIDDVAREIAEKLVHRHPHVFGDVEVADADEVKSNWEVLKQEEKRRSGPFEGVPQALPALQLADKLHSRARRFGFDWPTVDAAWAKVTEELDELGAAVSDEDREREIGDLLNAVVRLARRLGVDAEQALRRSAGRFRDRFEATLALATERGLDPAGLPAEDWLELYREAKGAEGSVG